MNFGAEYDKEEMMRKMAESAKMYDPSATDGHDCCSRRN